MNNEESLVTALKRLGSRIASEIEVGKASGSLLPETQLYTRKTVQSLVYGDHGVTSLHASSQFIPKHDWVRALAQVSELTKSLPEYASVAAQGTGDTFTLLLDRFVGRLVHRALYEGPLAQEVVDRLGEIFINEMNNRPSKYRVSIAFIGLVLAPEKICLRLNGFPAALRRVCAEDFEEDDLVAASLVRPTSLVNPASVLECEVICDSPHLAQQQAYQAVTVLRLFKAGSISLLSYRIRTDSLAGFGGDFGPSPVQFVEPCSVTLDDAGKLQTFWDSILALLPESLYSITATKVVDWLGIAYQRYSDALTTNGLFERRIANASMGLESLLMKEKDLIGYRLSLRAAKLLGYLGLVPTEVRETINDAYDYRSAFAHGDQVERSVVKKHDKKYEGGHTVLLRRLLEYLRLTLIAMMAVKTPKKEFIRLIDDSFIDSAKQAELGKKMEPVLAIARPPAGHTGDR